MCEVFLGIVKTCVMIIKMVSTILKNHRDHFCFFLGRFLFRNLFYINIIRMIWARITRMNMASG